MINKYGLIKVFAMVLALMTADINAQVLTQTFYFTGVVQTVTLPLCVANLTVTAYGASGANGLTPGPLVSYNSGNGGTGGQGAMVSGVYSLSGVSILDVYVGGAGTGSVGGFNGGGNGASNTNAGAGGGASDIRLNGTALSDRIIVAGGGGGGGNSGCTTATTTINGGNGGAGGGGNGTAGVDSQAGGGGQGGLGSNPGVQGIGCSFAGGSIGISGTSGAGGAGGFGPNICNTYVGGGGGGGGYMGGGGGGGGSAGTVSCTLNDQGGGGGGAGGSDFFAAAFTNTSVSNGFQNGNGLVVISYSIGTAPTLSVAGPAAICSGSTTTLTASGASTYTWSTLQTGSAVAVSPTTNTTYTVTGSSAPGCTNTGVASVSVNAAPLITVNSGTTCSGTTFTLVPSGASTYTYSSGSNTFIATASTTISVTGTDMNGCVSQNTAISSVTVSPTPIVTIAGNTAVLCIGESLTLTATGADSYSWTAFSTGSSVVVSPTVTTSYTVTGTNTVGCSAAAMVTQTVDACTGLVSTGLNTIQNGMKVYPNPNNGEFVIGLQSSGRLVITNVIGAVVLDKKIEIGINSINLTGFDNGVYFVHLVSSSYNGTVRVIKN